jgi:hypothetical protein
MASGATPAPTDPPGPLRATAVRAVVEVSLSAAAANAPKRIALSTCAICSSP